ncbi:hypothetical protein [Paenibacillus chitinolyticus]|uniref:hypothetical protein n=1 Tax=Paenibacillus chitinolyticus TaxID=79263 RepID=UPI003665AE00
MLKWWRTQDWFWCMAFLVYALGFGVVYKEMFMDFISYVSTFVSFALGAVAIFISVREATKTDAVKDEINAALGELRERTSQMDTKLSRFDPEKFNQEKDLKIEEIGRELLESIFKNLPGQSLTKEEVVGIVSEKTLDATDILKASLNIDEKPVQSLYVNPHFRSRRSTSVYKDIKSELLKLISNDDYKKYKIEEVHSIIGPDKVKVIDEVIEDLLFEGVIAIGNGTIYIQKR